ncbi:hypothetical protein EAG_08001 [Camponotus floridanus]|uniref:Uncharacterized protein n=1 Tax=Camponotus floridanus TaxID=104421 RepID=E2ANU4_CAMFO|nr:hypothetical protein EAG_08001 [Camponotus floridanus]
MTSDNGVISLPPSPDAPSDDSSSEGSAMLVFFFFFEDRGPGFLNSKSRAAALTPDGPGHAVQRLTGCPDRVFIRGFPSSSHRDDPDSAGASLTVVADRAIEVRAAYPYAHQAKGKSLMDTRSPRGGTAGYVGLPPRRGGIPTKTPGVAIPAAGGGDRDPGLAVAILRTPGTRSLHHVSVGEAGRTRPPERAPGGPINRASPTLTRRGGSVVVYSWAAPPVLRCREGFYAFGVCTPRLLTWSIGPARASHPISGDVPRSIHSGPRHTPTETHLVAYSSMRMSSSGDVPRSIFSGPGHVSTATLLVSISGTFDSARRRPLTSSNLSAIHPIHPARPIVSGIGKSTVLSPSHTGPSVFPAASSILRSMQAFQFSPWSLMASNSAMRNPASLSFGVVRISVNL